MKGTRVLLYWLLAATSVAAPQTDLASVLALLERGSASEALPIAQPEDAISELQTAVALRPGDPALLTQLGDAQMALYAKGIAEWRKLHPDDSVLETLTSGSPDATGGGAFRYDPYDTQTRGESDRLSAESANSNKARSRKHNFDPSGVAYLHRPVWEMNSREREQYEAPARAALASYDRALALDAGHKGALRGRADALDALGDNSLAGEAYEKAARASDNASLMAKAADAYARAQRKVDAVRAWQAVASLDPASLAAYRALRDLTARDSLDHLYYEAMVMLLSGKTDQALTALRKVTLERPAYAPGWRALGGVYLALRDSRQAIPALERALNLDGEDGLTEHDLATALLQAGNVSAARPHAGMAVRLRPDYAPAWFTMAVVAEKDGDPDAAVAGYEKAVELRPDWAEARFNLGALLLGRHEGSRALPHLERYLELRPNAPDAPDVRKTVEQVKASETAG